MKQNFVTKRFSCACLSVVKYASGYLQLYFKYHMQQFVSELIENEVNTEKSRALIGEKYMNAKDSAKHDEHGASISDLLQIVMVSPGTHLVQHHESQ